MDNKYRKPIIIEQLDIDIRYSQQQLDILNHIDKSPVTHIAWDRGMGKSFIAIDATLRRCIALKGYRCLFMSHVRVISFSVFEEARNWLDLNMNVIPKGIYIDVNSKIIEFSNGASIEFLPAPEDSSRISAKETHMLVIDNWELFNKKQVKTMSALTDEMNFPILPMGDVTDKRLIITTSL